MAKRISALITISIAVFFLSCETLDEPYLVKKENGGPGPGTEKKVLLEEYTGHKCPNCPQASKIAHDLKGIFGNQVVLVSIHAGFFSTPDQTGLYTADFRTTAGNELNNYFGIPSYPKGMVNRQEFGGNLVLSKDEWEAAIEEQLVTDADAEVTITHAYNAGDRKLDITLTTTFSAGLPGSFSICAFITEDSIVAPQVNNDPTLGPTPDWEDYVHMNVLRTAVNGTWGDPVNGGNEITANVIYTNNCSIILNSGWVAGQCNIVAFVYNDDDKTIIQPAEVKIAE